MSKYNILHDANNSVYAIKVTAQHIERLLKDGSCRGDSDDEILENLRSILLECDQLKKALVTLADQ